MVGWNERWTGRPSFIAFSRRRYHRYYGASRDSSQVIEFNDGAVPGPGSWAGMMILQVHEYHQDKLFLAKFGGHHFCTSVEVMPKYARASNTIHIVISLRQLSKTRIDRHRFLVTMACEYKEEDELRVVLETQHRIYLSSTTGEASIELL